MDNLPRLTLVVGGAASGKSDYAETLALNFGKKPYYLATGQAFDDEMTAKIARHKETRADAGWITIEEPIDLPRAFEKVPAEAVVLLDCATLWLTNLILSERDVTEETQRLLSSLKAMEQPIVVVSNETGQGIVPENKLARRFRQEQGQLNRKLAAQAELVVQVTVGLPTVLKGTLASVDR